MIFFRDLWEKTVGFVHEADMRKVVFSGIKCYDFKRRFFRLYDQKDGLITTTSADNLLQTSIRLQDNRLLFAGGTITCFLTPT